MNIIKKLPGIELDWYTNNNSGGALDARPIWPSQPSNAYFAISVRNH